MNHSKKAQDYFKQGYNCSQAVVLAFAEEAGLDGKTALKIASSFGGGMGRLREVCGAVSGMFIVAGLIRGYFEVDIKAQAAHYTLIQDMADEFKKANGSIICRELLGVDGSCPKNPNPEPRTDKYYKKRPCAELVVQAAEIAERFLMRELSKNN